MPTWPLQKNLPTPALDGVLSQTLAWMAFFQMLTVPFFFATESVHGAQSWLNTSGKTFKFLREAMTVKEELAVTNSFTFFLPLI